MVRVLLERTFGIQALNPQDLGSLIAANSLLQLASAVWLLRRIAGTDSLRPAFTNGSWKFFRWFESLFAAWPKACVKAVTVVLQAQRKSEKTWPTNS